MLAGFGLCSQSLPGMQKGAIYLDIVDLLKPHQLDCAHCFYLLLQSCSLKTWVLARLDSLKGIPITSIGQHIPEGGKRH